MQSEKMNQIKTALRYGGTLALIILFAVQLVGKVLDLVRVNHAGTLALIVFVVIYILPMLAGLALYKSLNRAFGEGLIAAKWRYVCVDWLLMLLLSTYVSLSHFWK